MSNSNVITAILLVTMLLPTVVPTQAQGKLSPYQSGYDHGCKDAKISPFSDRYIAQPTRGPQFHTKEFNTGYNAGLRACGNILEGVPADQLLQGDNDNDHDQNQGKAQESKSSSASGSTSSSSASNNNQIIINNNIQSKELKTGKALGFREEPTQSACAGLEGTEGDNGYGQGYVDAHVHFSKQKGFDSDPGNRHSAEYNKQYVNGYNDGWVDARNGVQDPKC